MGALNAFLCNRDRRITMQIRHACTVWLTFLKRIYCSVPTIMKEMIP